MTSRHLQKQFAAVCPIADEQETAAIIASQRMRVESVAGGSLYPSRLIVTDSLVWCGAFDVIDHENIHSISSGLEFQAELITKCLKDRRSLRRLRGADAQVLRHPLNFPVEFPRQPSAIDDDAVDGSSPDANQQVVERH